MKLDRFIRKTFSLPDKAGLQNLNVYLKKMNLSNLFN